MGINQNHYDVLGVSSKASLAEIRTAYRQRVRDAHPDVAHNSDHASIAAINEAWSVLSDPKRRAAFDGAARETQQAARPHTVDVEEVVVYPRAQFPWRSMVILAVVGIAVVLILNAFASPSTPRPPDQLLQAGSCVNIDNTNYVSEVMCSEPHDAEVVRFVALDMSCPTGTEAFPDRQGMGRACVVRTDTASTMPNSGQSG